MALRNHMALWVYRVPSEDNIADLPSRYEFQLLHDLKAIWRDPDCPNLQLSPC